MALAPLTRMALTSEDSFSIYFPESDLIDLLEKAEDLPGGLSSNNNNIATVKHPSIPQGQKRRRFSNLESTKSEATFNDDDIYAATSIDSFGMYTRNKRVRLQTRNETTAIEDRKSRAKPQIFKGVSFYASRVFACQSCSLIAYQIDGDTSPSVQDLRKLVVDHGGAYQPNVDRIVSQQRLASVVSLKILQGSSVCVNLSFGQTSDV